MFLEPNSDSARPNLSKYNFIVVSVWNLQINAIYL